MNVFWLLQFLHRRDTKTHTHTHANQCQSRCRFCSCSCHASTHILLSFPLCQKHCVYRMHMDKCRRLGVRTCTLVFRFAHLQEDLTTRMLSHKPSLLNPTNGLQLHHRVQDTDLARPDALDNRCLEKVADGLPLYQGAQLAVDTSLVSVLRRGRVPRQRSTTHDGAALIASRRWKEQVYPGLTGQEEGRTRLVVLAGGSVVRGMPRVPQPVGQFQGQARAPASAREGSPGVAAQMGVSLGLQRGQSLCPLSAGAQELPGMRWRHSAHHRGDQ